MLALAHNWRDLPLPEADRAMLAYVELLALKPSTATADHVETLRRVGFSDEEIFEIVMVTAYYALRCRMADGLGVDVDERAKHDPTLVTAFAYQRNRTDAE
ncbi:MAG: carboxymuconolactone decarboxylase family protein [Gammaproteobacteria bacterium]